MERFHAEQQIFAVHSGHIEIEDRRIDARFRSAKLQWLSFAFR